MTDRLNQFRWRVAESGYHWTLIGDHWFLTEPEGVATRSYAPLEHTGLFLQFAQLRHSRAEILRFANRYGLLGMAQVRSVISDSPGSSDWIEEFEVWIDKIDSLALAVRVRRMVDQTDVAGMSKHIVWEGDAVHFLARTSRGVIKTPIAAKHWNRDLLERFRPGDVIGPARYYLQAVINENLEGQVSSRLLWDASHARLNLYVVPATLLSAMWLQLAKAVDGDKLHTQCRECRVWFEVRSPDSETGRGARADKQFCGNACRARAWRKAKEGKK